MERMRKLTISGQKRLAFRVKRSHAFIVMRTVSVITSGSMVQVLVVRVLRSIMIAVKNTAVESRIVKLVASVTALWRSGIMYLPSLMGMVKVAIPN